MGSVASNLYDKRNVRDLVPVKLDDKLCKVEGGKAYFITKAFRRNNCDFIADTLVGFEIECELRIVSLDDDLGGLLHGLGADATL